MENSYLFIKKVFAKCNVIAVVFLLASGLLPQFLRAQAPTISYQSHGTYYVGLPVQLSPASSGVSAPGYGSASIVSAVFNARYIAYDQQGGNIYATVYTEYQTQFGTEPAQVLVKIAQGGTGQAVVIGNLTNASGVATDNSGNVWVADQINKAVYKVPYGSTSPVSVASGFNNPQGLAVDAPGNVYVADRGNAALEKIPASGGPWTTVVSGLSGINNVALDAAGNIFIAADGGIYRVPAGGSSASLYFSSNAPTGVAVDPAGDLYVADANTQRITKLLATGGTYIFPVDQATSVVLDQSGNVYTGCTSFNGYIHQYKPNGGYYLATPLPAGLSLSNSTGIVSGTPTTVSAMQLCWVYASNATGSTPAAFNIAVANPPLASISYTSPQTYPPGAAITPLAPVSTNVAPVAYKSNPATVGSGLVNPVGVAVDPQGNIFVSDDAASVNATPGRVYVEAANGGGQSVLLDGVSDPTSVATDAAGDLFISDTGLIQIFEIPAGQSNITNNSPELSAIGPVAADGAGNVFTFAPGDHTIYKLPSNLSGESPFASGFNSPAGVAADLAGNVYVSDAGNNNIVKINPDGSNAGVLASVQNPGPITVDAGGNLYVVNTQGTLYTIPAGTTTALQIGSGLTNVSSLAVDGKGNLYYTDFNNHLLKMISPVGGFFLNTPLPAGLSFANNTGVISGATTTSSPTKNYTVTAYNVSGGASTLLNIGVMNLAISYSGPNTYTTGAAIAPLSPTSSGVAAPGYSSSPVALGSGFKFPSGLALDAAGNVYVADENNNAVYKIPAAGGAPVALGSGFNSPLGVAVDAAGNVFVADANNNAVKEIPAGGGAIITLGSGFKVPASVAVDAAGNIYVADFGNLAIKKIPAGGGATVTLTTVSTNTEGVAVDAAGNVYFGTVFGNAVKMIPAGGGALVNVGSGFSQPRGVAIDAAGNVYIADTGNNAIKEIPAAGGAIITLGSGFSSPIGVAIDVSGNIYVGDAANAAVKKIKPIGGYFINPLLPAGLGLDKSTGIISGTPTWAVASPATNYTVFAYNSSGSTAAVVNIKTVVPQTITFNVLPAKTYGNADFSPGATSTNSGTSAITYSSDNTAAATIVSGNIHIVGAGTANITASQAGDSTHAAAANVMQQLTVSQAPLTVTANDQTMTQGQSVPALTVSYSGFVNGDNSASLTTLPSISTTGTPASPAGTYPINASGATAANYSIGYVAGILNITAPSAVADLSNLLVSAGTLSPAFASATTSYTAAVSYTVASISVTPIPTNLNAAITVNGTVVSPATASGAISLAVGANVVTIVVTAQNGITTQTYTITVTRAASANATLSGITLNHGALSPAFASGTTSYTATVPYATTSVTLKPIAGNASATIKVNGATVTSNMPSGAITLSVGNNIITTVVTAPDGATKDTYTVTVTRSPASANAALANIVPNKGTLSPAFSAATTGYTVMETNGTSSVAITPTAADPAATIKVNGTTVASGASSTAIALSVGSNTVTILVTAQDGVTSGTYTLNIIRPSTNATLASLIINAATLTPAFASANKSYSASVAYVNSSVKLIPTVTAAGATVTINGTAVASGAQSGFIILKVGANTITIVVTAQDDVTTNTYTLAVTRAAASANANLSALAPSKGSLIPAFIPAAASYADMVTNGTTSITLTPTTADATAKVTVNSLAVVSGHASGAIALAVGANVIPVVVTAQDGVTKQTYTVNVTRPSTNATLASLIINAGTLTPTFASSTKSYTASVAYVNFSIKLTPTVTAAGATVTINGTAVASGAQSGFIILKVGVNTITIVVTAQDGVTTNTYTLAVTRASASANANLSTLAPSKGSLTPAFAPVTASYADMVTNGTTSVTLTPTTADATAKVTVNGTAVVSGHASGAIALAVGTNTIATVVTAQDGVTTKTYSVNVIRPSANAKLSSLKISTGTLTPAFNANTTNYTASEINTTASITLTPAIAAAGAVISVNGTPVASGNPSGAIALAVGSNTITAVVTAQDGVTTGTYTITVTRAMAGANNVYEPISVETPLINPQLADDGLVIHQGISPNGDGLNDFLQIDNISNYPENNLRIMNRNGLLVYEAKGYNNSSKVFDGHSNKNGQMQLPGTYFYSLDYSVNGITKHKTGFLVLKW